MNEEQRSELNQNETVAYSKYVELQKRCNELEQYTSRYEENIRQAQDVEDALKQELKHKEFELQHEIIERKQIEAERDEQAAINAEWEAAVKKLKAEWDALKEKHDQRKAKYQAALDEWTSLEKENITLCANNAALREALKEAQYVLGQHRVTGSLIKTIQKALASTPADSLREYRNGEAKTLRKNFAKYLAPIYEKDRTAIAILCDEQLDKTGNLLGYVRKEAEAIRAMKEADNDCD